MHRSYKIAGTILLGSLLFCGILLSQTIEEGEAYIQQKKYAEAKSVFEKMIDKNKNDAEAHYRLGSLLLNRGYKERNVDDAVDQLEQAIDLNSNNAEYQFRYGSALGEKAQNSGILKQALLAPKIKNAFKRSVELNPNNARARVALAQYYIVAPSIMGGDEEEGWKQLDAAVKLDEFYGRTAKASFYSRVKKNDEADKEYKLLTKSCSENWRVWKNYGYFCLNIDRCDDAIKYFQKYVVLRSDTADSYQSLAEAFIKKGDHDQAIVNLKKSLSLDNNFVPAIISLGEAYQAKGQKKEAKENYQRALALAQSENYKKQAEKKLKEVE